jgi:hypothetical protein
MLLLLLLGADERTVEGSVHSVSMKKEKLDDVSYRRVGLFIAV